MSVEVNRESSVVNREYFSLRSLRLCATYHESSILKGLSLALRLI